MKLKLRKLKPRMEKFLILDQLFIAKTHDYADP